MQVLRQQEDSTLPLLRQHLTLDGNGEAYPALSSSSRGQISNFDYHTSEACA